MIYRTDYHIHTIFSDGRAEPSGYLPAAVISCLNEIGFSEHLTLFMPPQEWNLDPADIGKYIKHISKLKESQKDLKVRIGLEVDFFPGREEETRAILNSLPLDYIIGSVHYQGDITVDLGPEYYSGKDIDALYDGYFETVYMAVRSGLFDIIAHCDLIRIYGHRPHGDPEPYYRELARLMKKHNVAFEVNTNGRNRPVADFYPDRRYLHIFRNEDVPVCVNSDAHMPSRVGQYFDEAYNLLKHEGYTEMAIFENRKRSMIPF